MGHSRPERPPRSGVHRHDVDDTRESAGSDRIGNRGPVLRQAIEFHFDSTTRLATERNGPRRIQ
jgi:hypothetical protein